MLSLIKINCKNKIQKLCFFWNIFSQISIRIRKKILNFHGKKSNLNSKTGRIKRKKWEQRLFIWITLFQIFIPATTTKNTLFHKESRICSLQNTGNMSEKKICKGNGFQWENHSKSCRIKWKKTFWILFGETCRISKHFPGSFGFMIEFVCVCGFAVINQSIIFFWENKACACVKEHMFFSRKILKKHLCTFFLVKNKVKLPKRSGKNGVKFFGDPLSFCWVFWWFLQGSFGVFSWNVSEDSLFEVCS